MGLKILHSADWHLDSPFGGFSQTQRDQLKTAQRKLPQQLADLCIREGCDLVLLSGDVFDGAYTRESADLLKNALIQCAVPVLISPGNHDYLAASSPWLEERWPENVHIFDRELSYVSFPELNCRVYGAGYRSMDCPGLLKDFRAEGEETYKLCVLHGDPMQLSSPYCPVTAAQVRDSGLDYLALGHIHKAGSFRAGGTLCGWPGCPMGRGYDETREKGAYIVTLDSDVQLRFVPLDTPRFYDLEVDTGEDAAEALEEYLPGAGDAHFYRISLTGSGEGTLSELYSRFSHFPNLILTDHREEAEDLWTRTGEDSLEGIYFQLLRNKLDTGDGDTVCLAAEISRKLLSGREVKLP